MGLVNRRNLSDLRGVISLAVDATVGVTDLVEKMHHTIQLGHPPLGASRAGNTTGLTGFVYRSIRGTTRLLGKGLDAGMAPVVGLAPETASNNSRNAFVSVINGLYGDHLFQTDNPLAIKMGFRYRGQAVDTEQPDALSGVLQHTALKGKLMLFVHGLCLNDSHWTREDFNHAEALATDLGYTPLYLFYNTGMPIAGNGSELARMLEDLFCDWPQPVTELAIVGHSMGGLVARSACHHGDRAGHDWLRQLRSLVFIGTPHHGAPLERGSNWLDYAMDLSPYAAPFTRIAKKRSAGITDLRHGRISDEEQEFVALPAAVECYAMASTLGKKRGRIREQLIGDGLVPVDSALGRSKDPTRTLAIPESRQWLGFETGHLQLLTCPGVYTQLREWLV